MHFQHEQTTHTDFESSNSHGVSHKIQSWFTTFKQLTTNALLFFAHLFQSLFAICTMEKKSKHDSNWDVTLTPIQETTTVPITESDSQTPISSRKVPAGRASLVSTQIIDSSQGENEPSHTVVEVNTGEQGIENVDKSATEIAFNVPPTPIEQKPEDEELSKKLAEIEPAADESKNTLVIKNLPFKFKQQDLDKMLEDHKANPKNVRLLRDNAGRFTGIAFIRCPSKDEAARLILSMDGLDINGRSIQVEFKKRKSKKKQMQQDLRASTGSLQSSDESDRLSVSSEDVPSARKLAFSDQIENEASEQTKGQRPPPTRRLSTSAEHSITTDKLLKTTNAQQNQNAFANYQRRKSMSVVEGRTGGLPTSANAYVNPHRRSLEESGNYPNSAVPRSLTNSDASNNWRSTDVGGIRPIRQPIGPDGKSKDFLSNTDNQEPVFSNLPPIFKRNTPRIELTN
jgi:RNA recognition motif-containing protein